MTAVEFLRVLLAENRVTGDNPQLHVLRARRAEIEAILRRVFFAPSPSIRYGGSKAKDTMVWVSYDLDLTCYFPCDDPRSLEEIYRDVKNAFDGEGYRTLEKTSAIRIHGRDDSDFHVDVVPGRFFDGSQADVWLHRTLGTKERLKTNLDVHIAHVRDSCAQEAICCMKLWRHRFALNLFRTFALELITIKLLRGRGGMDLDARLRHVFEELDDHADSITIEDPANANNDLSELVDISLRTQLRAAAKQTLAAVAQGGWEKVFGPLKADQRTRQNSVAAAIAATTVRTKPWLPG